MCIVFLCTVQNLQKLHFKNNLRCRFAHFVHDTFSTFCTFVRFVHDMFLRICRIVKKFLHMYAFMNFFFAKTRTCKFLCAHVFCRILTFSRKSTKTEKRRNFRKCPKMSRRFLTCSRKCPKKAHVFLSGTRVVPGPTRLTTQGGKSRQNMH